MRLLASTIYGTGFLDPGSRPFNEDISSSKMVTMPFNRNSKSAGRCYQVHFASIHQSRPPVYSKMCTHQLSDKVPEGVGLGRGTRRLTFNGHVPRSAALEV